MHGFNPSDCERDKKKPAKLSFRTDRPWPWAWLASLRLLVRHGLIKRIQKSVLYFFFSFTIIILLVSVHFESGLWQLISVSFEEVESSFRDSLSIVDS